jgi:hypothetical protein
MVGRAPSDGRKEKHKLLLLILSPNIYFLLSSSSEIVEDDCANRLHVGP